MSIQMEMHQDWKPRAARLWGRKGSGISAPPPAPKLPARPPRVIEPFVPKPKWVRLFARPIEELDEYGNVVIDGLYMPQWKRITLEVCAARGIGFNEIISPRRSRDVVAARHEAWWRCKRETSMSFPAIGRRFGGKDHSTVLHGIKMHEQRMREAENAIRR